MEALLSRNRMIAKTFKNTLRQNLKESGLTGQRRQIFMVNQQRQMNLQSIRMNQLQRYPLLQGAFQRQCFSDKQNQEKPQEEAKTETKANTEKAENQATQKEDKKQDTKSNKKKEDTTTSSSDEETADTLNAEDVKKIKKLIADQDKEISDLKEQVKGYKEKLVYQLAENDNTIKRYKKEIDQAREYAVTKFAKDIVDVRDNVERAQDFIKKIKIEDNTDIQTVKGHFEQIMKGMQLTQDNMDSTLKRYGITQFDPKGEKFDPSWHEAIFTIPQSEQENNTVGEVMQTGWKIGGRVLRAAKVGIVKKTS